MRILLGIVLGALVLGVGGAAAILTIGEMAGVSQLEGAFAMGVIFQIGPLLLIAGAVIGGLLGLWWARAASARG